MVTTKPLRGNRSNHHELGSADEIELSPKQRAFIDECMKDRNATQAYIRAGYSPKGAQPSSAKLLLNPIVGAEIARRVEAYSAAADGNENIRGPRGGRYPRRWYPPRYPRGKPKMRADTERRTELEIIDR